MALLTILTLMVSHGSMGEAAPHFDDHASHTTMHQTDLDAHLADQAQPDGDRDAGHATHVHVAFDVARADMVEAMAFLAARSRTAPADTVALPSRGIAPLLEPPAA